MITTSANDYYNDVGDDVDVGVDEYGGVDADDDANDDAALEYK